MKQKLSRLGIILMAGILLFVLTGCGEKKDDKKEDKNRTPEKTVEEFVSIMETGDGNKVADLIDFAGIGAFTMCSKNYSKFDEYYDKVQEEAKKDEKGYNDAKKEALDTLKQTFDVFKDYGIKCKVEKIKTEKVKGSEKLTKVTFDIKMEKDGDVSTQEGVVLYTMEKDSVNYIVGGDFM